MNNYTRSDLGMQLLLHETEESVWRAELTHSIPLDPFHIHDFLCASNLILSECSLHFALQCDSLSCRDLIGTPINRIIFGQDVHDVVVHKDRNHLPHIVKFISVHNNHGAAGTGYLNSVGLMRSDSSLVGMLGRRRDITHQLKEKEQRQALRNSLTVKEYEVFLSLVKGRTVKQIASSAGMMDKTVYFHIENIAKKMHTNGILDIVQRAYRLGFLDSTEFK